MFRRISTHLLTLTPQHYCLIQDGQYVLTYTVHNCRDSRSSDLEKSEKCDTSRLRWDTYDTIQVRFFFSKNASYSYRQTPYPDNISTEFQLN